MNLQHDLFANFIGKPFSSGVGRSKEKTSWIFFPGKNVFVKHVFWEINLFQFQKSSQLKYFYSEIISH